MIITTLIIIISRSSLKLDHVGSKTRLLGHQATQVSDLGPLWPSCFSYKTVFPAFKMVLNILDASLEFSGCLKESNSLVGAWQNADLDI